jgi:hypothetical protein
MKRMLAVAGMVMWLVLQCAALAAEPAPVPAADPAASPAAELLKYAPPGAWAVLSVDFAAIRTGLLGDAPPSLTTATLVEWAIARPQAITVFALPAKAPLDDLRPSVCGFGKLGPADRPWLEWNLLQDSTKTILAGREAYTVPDGGPAFVFLDDQTIVWGDSAASLEAVLKAYDSPVGMGARLAELLKSGEGAAVRGAAAFPQDLKAMLSPEAAAEAPPFWLGMTGGALNVGVQKGLRANLRLLMANPADAANGAAMVAAVIESAKARMAAMPAQMADVSWPGQRASRLVLAKIKVQAAGAEVQFDLSLSEDEVKQLMQGFVSSLGRARDEAKKAVSRANLHNIGLGIAMHRAAHDDAYPPDLRALLTEGYLDDREMLLDPSDAKPVPVGGNGPPCSYEYIGQIPRGAPPDTIIAYTRKGIYPDGRNVLYEDVAVMWVPEADLHDPQGDPRKSLRASYQALMDSCGPDMAEEQKARLKVFFEVE